MKTIGILISVLFICNTTLLAQPKKTEIKTRKDYQLKGDVKQVIESYENYNKEMIVSEKLMFTPQGYLQYEGSLDSSKRGITYTYDKVGRLLKYKMAIDADNFHVKTYVYNIKGLLIKYTSDTEKNKPYHETYQYDENGNIRLQMGNLGKPMFEFRNTYDTRKRIVKIETYTPCSKRLFTTVITYLPNGWSKHVETSNLSMITSEFDNKERIRTYIFRNLVSDEVNSSFVRRYDDNDNLIEYRSNNMQINYTYNDQGEQISKEEIDLDGNKSKTVYIYLKHDAKGNWTERIVSNLTTYKRYTETRSITYYEDASTSTTTNDPIDAFLGKGNLKIPNNGDFVASAPSTVVAGEQFRLNYTIGIGNVDNFKTPSLNNFNVLMGPSKSTSTSTEVIKGTAASKSSITYTFVLQAEKAGSFTIPGAIVESKGKTYTSNTVTIKVTSK